MHEDLGLCFLLFGVIDLLMHVGHDRCRPILLHTPWLMHAGLGWTNLSLLDVALRMRRPWSMSPSWCRHAMADSCRSWMSLCITENVIFPMCINWCNLSDALKPLLKFPSWFAHDIVDTCRPCLTLHSIGLHCLEDVHMPHPCINTMVYVHVISRLHLMLLADIAFNMWSCHVRCV